MVDKTLWPVEFDWRKTALKLSKMAIKFAATGLTPSPDAVVDAVADNIKLKDRPDDAQREPTPEEWITLWLNQAMALAMIDVFRDAQAHARTPLPLEIEESVVTSGGLDPVALYEPQDIDVWSMVGQPTLNRLKDSGVPEETAWEIVGDLADRFVQRFWGLVAGHEARGGTIPTLLDRGVLRLRSEEAKAWQENRRSLIQAPREADKNPLLGGKASLQQIYVPLQAYEAVEDSRLKGLRRRGEDDDGDGRRLMRLVDLDEELDRWVESPKAPSFRIVAGGPGFGKSSAALMLAARRALDPEWRVLLVPLHQVDQAMTWDSVEEVIRATSTVTPQALAQAARGRKILLILDGLDELATKNERGVLPLDTLVSQIREVVGTRNREGRGMRAVLLGRNLAAGEAGRAARAADDMLHVLPLLPTMEDRDRYRWQDDKAPDFDQRRDWWRKYRAAVPAAPELPDSLFKSDTFAEITSLPVLMSLLAYSLGEGPAPEGLTDLSRVGLYDSICRAAYRRTWGESDQPPNWGVGSEDDFFRLVENIALATWHHNSRRATVEDLSRLLEASAGEDGKEQAAMIAESDGAGAKRLLMLFFFRDGVEGEARTARTDRMVFEFTHKSFADYLLARRLLRAARDKVDLGAWGRLFGAFRIEMAVVDFLRPEAARWRAGGETGAGEIAAAGVRDHLAGLLAEAVGPGFPVASLSGAMGDASGTGDLARRVADAEVALLATLDAVCRALDSEEQLAHATVDWPDDWAAWRMIARQPPPSDDFEIRLRLKPPTDPFRECLGRLIYVMDAAGPRNEESSIAGAAEEMSRPRRLRLDNANLEGADLEGADLQRANLEGADLRDADLLGADLLGANLEGADLEGTDLRGANLRGADLEGADLEGTDLRGADLEGADLRGADLQRADLQHANLRGAYLRGAYLGGADLRGVEGGDGETGIRAGRNLEQAILTPELRKSLGLEPQLQEREADEE